MDEIKDFRRRLAALSTRGAATLAGCRSRQSRLRELKREVLERLADLRSEIRERARRSLEGPPSPREVWERRQEGAKKLLADVQERVIGLVDGKPGDAVEALTGINEEVDARLADLEQLESRLSSGAGARRAEIAREAATGDADDDQVYAAAGAAVRPPKAETEVAAPSDDVYAAAGAAVQKGEPLSDAYCPHCGQGHEADDRFCRRCGRRLS